MSPAGTVAKYYDEYISVCVCLSVREDISGTARAFFYHFLCTLPLAVARSFFGVVAISYVLPVFVMTCFSYNGPYSGMNFATKDRFRKFRQESISDY